MREFPYGKTISFEPDLPKKNVNVLVDGKVSALLYFAERGKLFIMAFDARELGLPKRWFVKAQQAFVDMCSCFQGIKGG